LDQSNFVKECDDGFIKITGDNDHCYQFFPGSAATLPWQESRDSCMATYGAHLLEIFSSDHQTAVNNWLNTVKDDEFVGVWLGLTDVGHPGVMYSDALNSQPNWENWAFGEPSDTYAGAACGYLQDGSINWSTDRCGANHSKVCMKTVGRQCPSGWIYHTGENGAGKCYQYFVNGGAQQSWYTGKNYCDSIGAKMITIRSKTEQVTISKYFSEWSRGGVTRFWIGISDLMSYSKCSFTDTDGRVIMYTNWAKGSPPESCVIDECDGCNTCVYMDVVAGVSTNWKTANCFDIESFGCEVDVGTNIHDVPKPDNNFHCQQPVDKRTSFYLYTDDVLKTIFPVPQCYLQPHHDFDGIGLWDYCFEYCANETAIPVSIHSKEHNNFAMALMKKPTWLGMDNIKNGVIKTNWPYDKTLVDYTAWVPNYPNPDSTKTALVMSMRDGEVGLWKNQRPDNPSYPANCFCQKPAIAGNPDPPGYPEVPLNELCDTNWIFIPSSNTCVYHDINVRAWQSAEQNCVSMKGHLVSIGSPKTISELMTLGSSFYDPTSIGMT